MKLLKRLIEFVKNDIKTDYKVFRKIINGELHFKFDKEAVKKGIFAAITENWLWFFLIILAFLSGWFIASQYYQGLCNQEITRVVANFSKDMWINKAPIVI